MELSNKKSSSKQFGMFFGIAREKEYFFENFSFMISAGMPIFECLRALELELKTKYMRRVVSRVRDNVENGMSLSDALEETGLFGVHAITLIKNGEDGGTLQNNLKVIAGQTAKNRIFKSRLQSALMYPALILSVTTIVGLGVAWFILPKLADMFAELHVKLPFITSIFIKLGVYMSSYGFIIVPAVFVLILVGIYFTFYFPKTRVLGQYLLFTIPAVRKLIQELEVARMGYVLGTLNDSGLPILQAIGSLKESIISPYYRKFYDFLYSEIENGRSFGESFSSYKYIRDIMPPSVEQIISSGEQSGNLTLAFLKVSEMYEEKTELTSKNISTALEPILLIFVWLGVMAVAIAVIMPIYSLVRGVGQ